MRNSIVTVALGCLVSLTACRISAETIQNDIKTTMATKGVTMTKVECPKAEGATIECKGTDDNGTEAIFAVTLKGGTADWKLKGSFVDLPKVTEVLKGDVKGAKADAKVEVKCPAKSMLIKAGLTLTCDVSVDGTAMKSAEANP
jgi:hypothetical protein